MSTMTERIGGATQIKNDVLSGLTVALALIPEAIAFSFIAGVNPLVGLWSAVFMGFITSSLGGRPGMISGATGAIAVITGKAMEYGDKLGDGLGLQFVFAVVIVAGVIQILFGICKLGRFIRLVPHPVMMGFVNGLAVLIALGQIEFFKSEGHFMQGADLGIMMTLVLVTLGIIYFLPRFTTAVPSTLVAIVLVGLVAHFTLDARTIGDILIEETGTSQLSKNFPPFALPVGIEWGEHWQFILKTAFFVAMVGILESLMTLQMIDEITQTRGKANRESMAQGAANIASGLFGGMGGCATIGQSLMNMKSNGRGRLSGMTAAFALALFIMVGADIIIHIPIAALVGAMFMVVIATFEWSTFKSFGRMEHTEMVIVLVVTFVTIFLHNLALAVFVGVLLSALFFAVKSSKNVKVTLHKDTPEERIYGVEGMIYFASLPDFTDKFQASSDVDNIVIDFENARVCDYSALEALSALSERYRLAGKTLKLRHLSSQCRKMLQKADSLVNIEVLPDDPTYTVASIKGTNSKIL